MIISPYEGATTVKTSLPTPSAVLFALAGLIDIAFLSTIGTDDAPIPVIILFALLGAGTLVTLVPARRGNRPALITAVVLRVISALLAFVSFFAGAPVLVMTAEVVVIVATVVALVLLRRQPAAALRA
jgi:hypothetical protein